MSTELSTYTEEPAPVAVDDGAESSLIRLAIERGVDVEVLERLVALQERVTERNARAAFFEALAGFQEDCPVIRKVSTAKIDTRSGGQFSYTFAPLEEVTQTIRPHLRRHGLSYSWDVEPGDKHLSVICVLRHVDGHEERASFPVPIDGGARMSAAQANGAALTYGKRQSLTSVLGLTTADEDKDAARRHAVDASELTDREAADLSALMDEVGVDRKRFLAWLGVDSIAAIRKHELPRAIKALERRRNGGGAQ